MNAPLRKAWTQDAFFSWAERQDERYEFNGVEPVAMNGDAGHSEIGVNLITALKKPPERRAMQAARPGCRGRDSRPRHPLSGRSRHLHAL